MSLYKSVFLIFCILSTYSAEEYPSVTTSLGNIRGHHKTSTRDKIFSAFEGIPYAKPPVGELRFEPPQPIEPWTGEWDAGALRECPQTGLLQTGVAQGDEDCLYLNVYVPRKQLDPEEKLDVIVHIHGGFFTYGSGHRYSHPDYFMDEEVIFVSFNYRLNIFGFLSTQDDVVSGNNGLKDQVLALKWVRDNIANFGGNPDSVTITGLSAGASSVHYHYLSEMSVGLFHKGFSQSGVALNSFALQEDALNKAKKLGEAVGCPTTTTSELVSCLKTRPFKDLLSKMPLFLKYQFLPVAPFAPVLEKGSKAFIKKNPYFLLATGDVQDLPWLVSTVSHEGLFPGAFFKKDPSIINKDWTDMAAYLLDYKDSLAEPVWKETAEKIKEHYLDNKDISDDNFDKVVKMLSERFLADVESAIKLQAKTNKSPVFYYQFSYPDDSNLDKTVSHGEDAQYFFYSMYKKQPTENEVKVKETLMDMLVTFAKTGKPRLGDINWEPINYPEISLLRITGPNLEDIETEVVKELANRDFWKSLGFLENQNLVLMKDEL